MKSWSHIRDVFKNIGIRSLVAALVVFLLTVAATFVGGMERIGYDVRLTYEKREDWDFYIGGHET